MSRTVPSRLVLNAFVLASALGVPAACWAYIDRPAENLTVPRLVLEFRSIAVVEIDKLSLEKGVAVFKLVEQIQGPVTFTTTRHSLFEGTALPPELKKIKVGDKALFFSNDGYNRGVTLLDGVWYCSNNLDKRAEWWHMGYTASHYDFNCAYTGDAADLTDVVRRLLRGDEVVVKGRKKKQMPETQWVRYNLRHPARKEVVAEQPSGGVPRLDLSGRSFTELEKGLGDEKAAVRMAAAEALARHDRVAVEPLAKALRGDADPFVRRAAAVSLGSLGATAKDAMPVLLERLQSQYENLDGLVGSECGVALSKIDPDGSLTVALLIPKLKGPSPDLAMRTADQLGMLGPKVKSAAPALIEALQNKHPGVRSSVVNAIYALKPDPKLVVPAMIGAVKDPDHHVRAGAVRTLEAVGPDAKAALPVLREALKDSNDDVRTYAKDAIQRIMGK